MNNTIKISMRVDGVLCVHDADLIEHVRVIDQAFRPITSLIEGGGFERAFEDRADSSMVAISGLLAPSITDLINRGYWLNEVRIFRDGVHIAFDVTFTVPAYLRKNKEQK